MICRIQASFILIVVVYVFFNIENLFGQKTPCHQNKLTHEQYDSLIKEYGQIQFQIDFQNVIIYNFSDNKGDFIFECISEKGPYLLENKDSAISRIQILNYRIVDHKLIEMLSFSDKALPDFVVGVRNILFLEDYISFCDLNDDSIVDPIIVYYAQSSITVVLFYGENKIIIENSFIGYHEQTLNISSKFYNLPFKVQEKVKALMIRMESDSIGHFPEKWQNKMNAKKLLIKKSVH